MTAPQDTHTHTHTHRRKPLRHMRANERLTWAAVRCQVVTVAARNDPFFSSMLFLDHPPPVFVLFPDKKVLILLDTHLIFVIFVRLEAVLHDSTAEILRTALILVHGVGDSHVVVRVRAVHQRHL